MEHAAPDWRALLEFYGKNTGRCSSGSLLLCSATGATSGVSIMQEAVPARYRALPFLAAAAPTTHALPNNGKPLPGLYAQKAFRIGPSAEVELAPTSRLAFWKRARADSFQARLDLQLKYLAVIALYYFDVASKVFRRRY